MSLIRFFSPAGGEIFMLSQHVLPVMREAGIRFSDASAILPEDLPEAIEHLESAVSALEKARPKPNDDSEEVSPAKPEAVALPIRFYPLLELMRAAARKKKMLHWETL